jgi:hypothetical protein
MVVISKPGIVIARYLRNRDIVVTFNKRVKKAFTTDIEWVKKAFGKVIVII